MDKKKVKELIEQAIIWSRQANQYSVLIKSISNHNPHPAITAEWGFLFAMKQSN